MDAPDYTSETVSRLADMSVTAGAGLWNTAILAALVGGLAGALVGAVAAFLLGLWRDGRAAHKRQLAHWRSLQAEIEYCGGSATTYLTDDPVAPAYRLPSKAYDFALPGLLADGVVKKDEMLKLLKFYNEVEAANRSLDMVATAIVNKDRWLAEEEPKRTPLKMQRLAADKPKVMAELKQRADLTKPVSDYYDAAIKVVNAHADRRSWLDRVLTPRNSLAQKKRLAP